LSIDLIAILVAIVAVLVTSLIEVAILYRMRDKMDPDDAALYLQSRKIQEVLKEMRQELTRAQ